MKYSIVVIAIFISLISCNKKGENNIDSSKKSEFWVRGNCEMCKERIETALLTVQGVSAAVWNVDSKMLSITFDTTKTNELLLKQTTAKLGHETKEIIADEKAHQDLPECCKRHAAEMK